MLPDDKTLSLGIAFILLGAALWLRWRHTTPETHGKWHWARRIAVIILLGFAMVYSVNANEYPVWIVLLVTFLCSIPIAAFALWQMLRAYRDGDDSWK